MLFRSMEGAEDMHLLIFLKIYGTKENNEHNGEIEWELNPRPSLTG